MNFIPTRPIEDIAREYVTAFYKLYDPLQYLNRVYRHFMSMSEPRHVASNRGKTTPKIVKAAMTILWRQGVVRSTRWAFWHHLFNIYRHKPRLLVNYLVSCALLEHFVEYREIVRRDIEEQLQAYLTRQQQLSGEQAQPVAVGTASQS